jgi:hemolysin III
MSPREIREELVNALTHGFGLALCLAGVPVLIVLAALHARTAWHITGVSVYGASLTALYACSTVYHAVRSPGWKSLLQVADHSAIYLLIAGTYTPFTLVTLRGGWGWFLLGAVWTICIAGILLKIVLAGRLHALAISLYVLSGWLIVVAIRPVWQHLPGGGLLWLLAGGTCYTGGLVFYGWKRCPYHHAVWHVFVLAGSVCHYFSILFYVLPARLG